MFVVQGSKIKPDPLAGKNEKRRKFCSKYDGYGDFCEGKTKLTIYVMCSSFTSLIT